MRASILATGDELVRGRTRDTNTPTIARELSSEGFGVVGSRTVADDLEALTDAIRRAAGEADVVLMTGGLGPTEDDCTRRAAAEAAGVELVRDERLAAALADRWARRGREMPVSNLLQADVPAGAEVIPNRFGTAAGFALAVGQATLYALPGPPHEMHGVLSEEVLPRLRERFGGADRLVLTRTVDTFGAPESRVGELLEDLMKRGARPHVGTSAELGIIRLVVHDEGPPDDATARVEATIAEIRRRLGPIVFGSDGSTLAEVVVRRLREAGLTLVTAESCTGGGIGAELTDVSGASAVYLGGCVTYSNAMKSALLGVPEALLAQHGAVSEPVARAMATGARERLGADLAVAVTGIAGPGGGTPEKPVGRVHFALARGTGVTHVERTFPGTRELVRSLAVKTALDLVRRSLGD